MPITMRATIALASLFAAFPAAAADDTQTAEQFFKNIQVLKGIPVPDLSVTMNMVAGSLGVNCLYCHTPAGPWPQGFEKDDIQAKRTAREMMRMTRQINEGSFSGRTVVTCATCHTGHTHPAAFVLADAPEAVKARVGQLPARPDTTPLPAAEELFAKYEVAIGGDAAVAKLTTRHLIGTSGAGGVTVRAEQFATSRGLFLEKITAGPQSVTNGFDGTRAYTIPGDGAATLAIGAGADSVKLGALFQRVLRLKDAYPQAQTLRKEKLGDKDVYVVSANLPLDRYTDLLSFDAGSGLLLRRTTLTRTPLGPMSQTVDFENYREVEGVRVSMDQVRSGAGAVVQRLHIEEIHFNQPMDDAMFAMRAAGRQ